MKNFLIAFVLLIFSKTLFAADAVQCPDASQFKHAPGQEWELGDKAKLAGWNFVKKAPKDSATTTIPADAAITVILNIVNKSSISECDYGSFGILMGPKTKFPDVIHVAQPPFTCANTACTCHETIAHTDTCTWKWL